MRLVRVGIAALGLLFAAASSSRATYTIAGVAADQTTFLNMVNANSQGGVWSLNNQNQLVFTANGVALNVFATELTGLNNMNNARTVSVMQDFPGVLVGSFGPRFTPAQPAGTQLIDLGDIQHFAATAVAQVQPLLDTQGSVLMHELAEVNTDGGAANFANAHAAGIAEQNTILAGQGVSGMRTGNGNIVLTAAAPGTNFATFVMTIPFQTTAAVAAAGGQPALANGAAYNELIQGRVTGAMFPFNYNITNIAQGLFDTGVSYDGTGFSVDITSVTVQAVPEPAAGALLLVGGAALLGGTLRRRRAA